LSAAREATLSVRLIHQRIANSSGRQDHFGGIAPGSTVDLLIRAVAIAAAAIDASAEA